LKRTGEVDHETKGAEKGAFAVKTPKLLEIVRLSHQSASGPTARAKFRHIYLFKSGTKVENLSSVSYWVM